MIHSRPRYNIYRNLSVVTGTVHLWYADLDAEARNVGVYQEILSTEEEARAEQYESYQDRNRFILRRAMLRSLLGLYLNCPARRVELLYHPNGKPYVSDYTNKRNLQFFRRGIYITSYNWNGAVVGYPPPGGTTARRTFKLSQFKPEAVLQWETDETVPSYFNDFSNYPDEGISSRHGDGAVLGLFGGSTERMTTNEFHTLAGGRTPPGRRGGSRWVFAKPRPPNRLWCSPQNNGHP